jgi:TRAP transporter TAXI family solute receptor
MSPGMGGARVAAGLGTLAALAVLAACSPNDPPGGEGRLSIATGGSGGVYQVYGGGLADVLSDELPDSPTTAETTSASVDNLLLVANGESDIAFTLGDTAIDAVRGDEAFPRKEPLRALGTLYPNITQVVVKADSGIESIEDLKGKTVSIGAPNSGTEIIALRMMEVAGLDPDEDISKRGLGVGESAQAIRDGSIDAFFWSGGVPTSGVTDLATTDDIRLLPTDAYLDGLREKYGEAYQEAEIEGGEYPGVDEPVKTVGVPNLLMVNASMDDDLAFEITKALYDNKKALAAIVPSAEKLDPETGKELISPVQMHPGAQRYYDEAGG